MSDNTRIVADHGGDACTVDGAGGVRAGGCRRVTVTNSRDDSTSHVYCCTRPYAKENVVFFGGDVQVCILIMMDPIIIDNLDRVELS